MRTQVAEILLDIEAELRQLDLWDPAPPPAEALASTEPFCIDTLTLPQWLQFVFIPTMYHLLAEERELPQRCGIAPLAEEFFRGTQLPVAALLRELARVDELLSAGRS